MSLLREIQDAAVDATTPLAVVLRKCMLLAARLGHEPFKKWVDQELNGYPPDADLPEYRRVGDLLSIGNFAGPMGRQLLNIVLPLGPVPEHARHHYETAEFREGVARLADVATAHDGGGKLGARWPGDLIALVADKYFQGYALLDAHVEIPTSTIVGVLDAVRNKVLKFALEIEQQNPAAGDAAPGARPVPEERVTQIFNTIASPAQEMLCSPLARNGVSLQSPGHVIVSARIRTVPEGTRLTNDPRPRAERGLPLRGPLWPPASVRASTRGASIAVQSARACLRSFRQYLRTISGT